jgi:transcriptional regulator of acetoin/glycerol metabolism
MATLEAARDDAERQAIAAALRAAGGKVAAAAASLGISRVTLWSKMRRLGLGR